VGDPVLKSDITRRVDFALFMVEALDNDDLVHEAPRNRQPPERLGAGARGGLRASMPPQESVEAWRGDTRSTRCPPWPLAEPRAPRALVAVAQHADLRLLLGRRGQQN
jgi:hypothetical protein